MAFGARRLDQAELGDVARDGRLGDVEALRAERVDHLALAPDRARGDQLADRSLALLLVVVAGRAGAVALAVAVHAAPACAGRTAVMCVPKVGSAEGSRQGIWRGRVGDDRLGAVPAERTERGPHLGDHPTGDDARFDERLGLARGERVETMAVRIANTVHVGQQDELAGPETGRDPGRHVVGVDVADDPVRVAGQRRDDRDLPADEDRVEQVAAQADDRSDETEVGDPLRDEQAAIDARQPDGIDAEVAQAGHQLAVDHSPEYRGGHLERLGVGHAQTALELARDAEAVEPLGDALAAAMDQDHGTSSRDRGHFRQDLALLRDGRATQLDDQHFAHVVYSEFSITYVSVRSQPKASPVPAPRPRSSAKTTSGASIAARAAARSKATGPPCAPSNTR